MRQARNARVFRLREDRHDGSDVTPAAYVRAWHGRPAPSTWSSTSRRFRTSSAGSAPSARRGRAAVSADVGAPDRRDRLPVARPRLRAQAARRDRRSRGRHGTPDERERALLEDFSRFVGRARPVLVTYNGRSFDLPVIALRSLCHGVSLGWYYREQNVRYRYSEEGHLDLCDWLADHGATRSGSLDAIARLIGLPGKVGVDGSQVEGLYRAGQLASIQQLLPRRRRADRAVVPALPPAPGSARSRTRTASARASCSTRSPRMVASPTCSHGHRSRAPARASAAGDDHAAKRSQTSARHACPRAGSPARRRSSRASWSAARSCTGARAGIIVETEAYLRARGPREPRAVRADRAHERDVRPGRRSATSTSATASTRCSTSSPARRAHGQAVLIRAIAPLVGRARRSGDRPRARQGHDRARARSPPRSQ